MVQQARTSLGELTDNATVLSRSGEIVRSYLINAKREAIEFELNTLYRLEKTKRPGASIAVYAELLATMRIQGSPTINCEVRFLSQTLKMGTRTVIETLNEFRRMGLIKFIPTKGGGKKRLIEMIYEG
jgi:hypothetical protein